MYTNALVWLLLAPFFLSLVIFTLRGTEIGGKWLVEALHVLSISIVLVLTAVVIQGVLVDGEVFAWKDMLYVDALAAVFLLIVGVVGFLVGLYSLGYIRNDLQVGELNDATASLYYALFELFLFTMLLTVTANNIIITWVAIEATTLG